MELSGAPFSTMLLRRLNTWYSACDGDWNNPNTWLANSLDKKNFTCPQTGDNVIILHNVNLNQNADINHLYIQGKLSSNVNSLTLTVRGDLQANGAIDFTSNSTNLILYGCNNFVNSFTCGNSTVTYQRVGDQNIMNLGYKNLMILGKTGKKYMTSDLVITGSLNVNNFSSDNAFMECGTHNLTVNGTTSILAANGVAGGNFAKSGAGNILFIGAVSINSNTVFGSNITGVEFRGGAALSGFGGTTDFNCPVTFTTNNQTLSGNGCTINNGMTISGAITVTNTNASLYFNSTVNGDNVGSTLNNNGLINLQTTTIPMSTGVFNYMNSSTSSIAYRFNGNYTLPYTTYAGLQIFGTGTKTLSGNTQVNYNLIVSGFTSVNAKLDCSTYNLTVNGTTSCQDQTAGILSVNSGSTLLFKGAVTFNTDNFSYATGVILEFRAGATFGGFSVLYTCAATINFTTANQNVSLGNGQTYSGPINISGGITVSVTGGNIAANAANMLGVINGASASDIFNAVANFINYQNATAPMVTGKLYCNQSTNTWIYGASGNQDIQVPSDPTPGYKNLTLQGSGAKRLLGNVSVKGTYTLTGPATLNSNGFSLTNP